MKEVTIHNHFIGGGFGRGWNRIWSSSPRASPSRSRARQGGWTREEDIRHESFDRPTATCSGLALRTGGSSAGSTECQARP